MRPNHPREARLPGTATACAERADLAAPQHDAVSRTVAYMKTHFRERISLEQLSALTGLSLFHFSTLFRRTVGISPYRYLCLLRVEHAQLLLRQGYRPSEAAADAGFFDQSHLSRHFKNFCGITPGRYSARHANKSSRAAR